MILAPSPISINLLVFPASAALFDVEVFTFIVEIDSPVTPVAPNDSQEAAIYVDPHDFTSLPNN
jgi:hypothetical protein